MLGAGVITLIADVLAPESGWTAIPWAAGLAGGTLLLVTSIATHARRPSRGAWTGSIVHAALLLMLVVAASTGAARVAGNYESIDNEVASGASEPAGLTASLWTIYGLAGAAMAWLLFRIARASADALAGGTNLAFAGAYLSAFAAFWVLLSIVIVGGDPSAEDMLYLGIPATMAFGYPGGILLTYASLRSRQASNAAAA